MLLVFTYSGFEQPNYVLGEIGQPRKRFPRGIAIGTIISCILYMVTNISYVSLASTTLCSLGCRHSFVPRVPC